MSLFATKLVDEYGNATYNLTGLGYGRPGRPDAGSSDPGLLSHRRQGKIENEALGFFCRCHGPGHDHVLPEAF